MTVIAWDGSVLAADKQATNAGLKMTATKLRKINGCICAATGDWDRAQSLYEWFARGAKPEDFPDFQKTDDGFVGMVVVHPDNTVVKYERAPYPYTIEDKLFAVGSGRDFALGAMATGANAIQAVHIASRFDSGCGMGVDYMKHKVDA